MKTLIVVDDFLYDLKFLQRAIDWKALDIRLLGVAENGEAALLLIEQELPDIVLTDIEMPVMDGIKLTKLLKERYPNILVVFMSCHEDFQYAKTALQLQVKAYITKPLMPEEIIETMETLLNQMKEPDNEASLPKTELPPDQYVDKRVEEVKQYISMHISEELTVQSIAQTLYISPNYLNSLFKEHEKVTIPRYIEHLRIEYACRLLRNTSLRFYEIAGRVGYQNVPYFSRIFKQITGYTPRDYRIRARASND